MAFPSATAWLFALHLMSYGRAMNFQYDTAITRKPGRRGFSPKVKITGEF